MSNQINIKYLNNIKEINFPLEENKINFIFGLSGSGKSSIAKALTKKYDSQKNKNVNSNNEIEVNLNEFENNEFVIFDDEYLKNFIIEKDKNDYYNIMFSNNEELNNIKNDIEQILNNNFSQEIKNIFYEKYNNLNNKITKLNIKLNKKDESLSKNSYLSKLLNSLDYISTQEIKEKTISNDHISWISQGCSFEIYINENKCPFCSQTINNDVLNEIKIIGKFDYKNYGLIEKLYSDNENVIDSLKKLNNENKNSFQIIFIEEVKILNELNKLKNILDTANYNNFFNFKTIDEPNQIIKKFDERIYNSWKKLSEESEDLSKKINNLILETNKLIEINNKKINTLLKICSIPYKFVNKNIDDNKKEFDYIIVHEKIDETCNESMKENLSYGEKNFICLLLFVLANKNKNLIIDDPASSFDEFRRHSILFFLFDEFNNETALILSHDNFFANLANSYRLDDNKKEFANKIGKMLYISNKNEIVEVKEIKEKDFSRIDFHIINNIKKRCEQNNDCLDRVSLMNLRILLEKSNNEQERKIYGLLSKLIKSTNNDEKCKQVCKESKSENIKFLLSWIKDRFNISANDISINKIKDYEQISFFEKILLWRFIIFQGNIDLNLLEKKLGINNDEKMALKGDIDTLIHLNLFPLISLNPYEFDIFAPRIYVKLFDKINKINPYDFLDLVKKD